MELTALEIREKEQVARQENLFLMRQCLADARNIINDEKMMDMQSHVISLAETLFNKRARNTADYLAEALRKKEQKAGKKVAESVERTAR